MGQPDWKAWHKGISMAGWKKDKGWSMTLPTKSYKDKESGDYVTSKSLIDWDDNSELVVMAAIATLACEAVGKEDQIAAMVDQLRTPAAGPDVGDGPDEVPF